MPKGKLEIAEPIIQHLVSDFTKQHHISLYVKRLDLIHQHIKGNKWYKLKHNIAEATRHNKTTLLTFGGAFSNHIYATAAAGKAFAMKTIGIIRGEATQPLNHILSFATENGMQLCYIDRSMYKLLRENFASPLFYEKLANILEQNLEIHLENIYFIPEGGANEFAVLGCQEISQNLDNQFDVLCCACGTGGTLAGIIQGCPSPTVEKIGFVILKGGEFMKEAITKLCVTPTHWDEEFLTSRNSCYPLLTDRKESEIFSLQTTYHFGGYAKKTPELLAFIDSFNKTYNIIIEPVYTGKMFFGLFDLINKGYFKSGTRILAIHTGGTY